MSGTIKKPAADFSVSTFLARESSPNPLQTGYWVKEETRGFPKHPKLQGSELYNSRKLDFSGDNNKKSGLPPIFFRRSFVKSLPILCKMTCSSKGSVRILQRIGGKILGGKPLFLDPPTVSMHKLRSTGSRVIILGVWESPRGVRIENAQTI